MTSAEAVGIGKKCRFWPFWGFWRHFSFDYDAGLLNIGAIERDSVRVREVLEEPSKGTFDD